MRKVLCDSCHAEILPRSVHATITIRVPEKSKRKVRLARKRFDFCSEQCFKKALEEFK